MKPSSDFIQLGEVIHRMDSGERFSIRIVQADVKRGRGGKLVDYVNCFKEGTGKKSTPAPAIASTPGSAKFPNHFDNSTRNIRIMGTRDIRKVHLRLITRFNGKRVI